MQLYAPERAVLESHGRDALRFLQRPGPCVLRSTDRTFTPRPDAIVSICSIAPTISNFTRPILARARYHGKSGNARLQPRRPLARILPQKSAAAGCKPMTARALGSDVS